jgi:hypothetical protein
MAITFFVIEDIVDFSTVLLEIKFTIKKCIFDHNTRMTFSMSKIGPQILKKKFGGHCLFASFFYNSVLFK